jgi:hypothetical protein
VLPEGCNSTLPSLSNLRSQISNKVSLEKSASTAPAFVPVTINGAWAPGLHAKHAVRGISRNRTMAFRAGGMGRKYKKIRKSPMHE